MHPPVLTIEEQTNIESGSWFSRLSAPLRESILGRSSVRRLADGALLSTRGAPAEEWCGVALGAVRISSVSLSGKQVTLTYAEPGVWFGDIALFDGMPRTHDANAHGATTLLVVRRPDFHDLHLELHGDGSWHVSPAKPTAATGNGNGHKNGNGHGRPSH